MGCYESREDTNNQSTDHKSKGKKKKTGLTEMAWERINRETKLLKAVTQFNQLHQFD